MGCGDTVESSRLTSSAKSRSLGVATVSSSSRVRVHSSPAVSKGRRKDVTGCRRDGPNDPVDKTEKSQTNGATNTLPSDVKLSPEVIVSDRLKFQCSILGLERYWYWVIEYWRYSQIVLLLGDIFSVVTPNMIPIRQKLAPST